MKEKKLIIKAGIERYPVIIGNNLINKLDKILNKNLINFINNLFILNFITSLICQQYIF